MIAKHPEVKQKMYDEIDSVLGDRLVATYEDQTKLTYTSMVIKETLRLFPVGPGTARKPTTDLQIGKYFIPKDTSILVDFILLHRNPKYWDNPHEFKPERFDRDSGDNEDGKGKPDLNVYTYTPFSAGPRICIGKPFAELEMKILLAMFCKSFDFEIATDSAPDVPPHERFTTSITMRPMSYTVKLKKRS
ncbi:cytochrome P450 [Paraphysoderma sedebokerense]|nr:cytochrome P450 [Paraphysoderma sedebokerense]